MCATGIGRAKEWDLGDEGLLSRCQDDPDVDILALVAGTLYRRRVRG